MKQHLITLCLLLAAAVFAGEYLVGIDNLNEEKKDFKVIERVDNHYIILSDEDDIARMKKRNYTYRILDNNPRENEYYLVFPWGEDVVIDEKIFAKYGVVLDVYEKCVLMRTTVEQLQLITEYTTELIFIDLTPIKYVFRQKTKKIDTKVKYNPLIEKMIEEVSVDSCESLLRELTDIYSRYAGNTEWNKDVVVPWFKEKFLEYGCDSVFETEVSGYDAPAVTGIRTGKKNPSLEKFCLLGAHPDNILNQGEGDIMGRIYGANDNGSGVVGVLEALRAMKNFTFENTIYFSAFNAEEVGCRGSDALAKYFSENDFQLIGGAFTYDMIGNSPDGNGSESIKYSTDIIESEDFANKIKELAELYDTYEVTLRGTQSVPSDVTKFWNRGYSGVCGTAYSGGPGIHTLEDSIGSWTSFEQIAKVTSTGLATIAYYAVPMEETHVQNGYSSGTENQEITILNNSNKQVIICITPDNKNNPFYLRVYNLSGQIITTLSPKRSKKGSYSAVWNCSDYQGNSVARGLYVLEYRTNAGNIFKKIMLIE